MDDGVATREREAQEKRDAAKERQRQQQQYERDRREAEAAEKDHAARERAPDDDGKQPPKPATVPGYPYVVSLTDGRDIECDFKDEQTHYLIIKRALSFRVPKSDVKSIRRASGEVVAQSATTRPTTAPATRPAEKVERE